jgi:hypothetical protein
MTGDKAPWMQIDNLQPLLVTAVVTQVRPPQYAHEHNLGRQGNGGSVGAMVPVYRRGGEEDWTVLRGWTGASKDEGARGQGSE